METLDAEHSSTRPAVPPTAGAPVGPDPSAGALSAAAGWLLALQARLLQHREPEAAAQAVLAELAQQLRCERASLGWLRPAGTVRLATTTAGDARRSQAATLPQHLEAAMDEAVEEGALIVYPPPAGGGLARTLAHAELARINGRLAIATLPVVGSAGVCGALVLERPAPFDSDTMQRARDAALFVAPWLDMHRRLHAKLWQRLRLAAQAPSAPAHGPAARDRRRLRWLLLLLPLALLAWPVRDEVVAPARVDGAGQQVLAAPADGFIARAEVRPGAVVKAGQLLVTLQDREPALERQRWLAEQAQADKQYREAMSQDEPAPIALARSRLEQAQAQLALAEAALARTRLLAPFDGVVVSGDLQQAAGMPVQRGQVLMTVAPALDLRVVAEVDEQDVARLRSGQPARVLFAAQGQAAVPFRVERISPVATVMGGRNVFEVEGAVTAPAAAGLRPGQRGWVRIEVGEAAAAVLAWNEAGHWLRRWHWRLLG
jgi:biotin carboxyl carrier protein